MTKQKIYTITWEDLMDNMLLIEYAEGSSANEAIIKTLPVIFRDRQDLAIIAHNAPKVGLVRLLQYLENFGVKANARTLPEFEEISRGELTYLKGDATYPQTSNKSIICHCCNDLGIWGGGFVLAVSKRWQEPEKQYREAFAESSGGFKLGFCQKIDVEDDKAVFNMVAQKGVMGKGNPHPLSYDALRLCLTKLCQVAKREDREVHAPKFGADRAGGNWRIIEEMIVECLVDKGVKVFVYDFEG